MISASNAIYTTSDLRRAEVIDEAFQHPVSVRDGKTGNLLVMLPQAFVNRSNAVQHYTQLFTRVVVECQRPDPSSVALDEAGYIVSWTHAQRQKFVREFAEALSTSINEGDPAAVESFIAYASHASDPVPPQFHASFVDGQRELLDAHMSRP
jgi:hypothetical protein